MRILLQVSHLTLLGISDKAIRIARPDLLFRDNDTFQSGLSMLAYGRDTTGYKFYLPSLDGLTVATSVGTADRGHCSNKLY